MTTTGIRFYSALVFVLILAISADRTAGAAVSLTLKDGTSVKLYDKSYALVIGVSEYQEWPDLPGVQGDIESVSKILKRHGFKIIKLMNPSRIEFDAAVRNFIADYGQAENNRLLVYYAGHGHTHTTRHGRQLGYLVPADAPLPYKGHGPFKRKAISMLDIETFAKQLESKHALFMFDSCFSGSLFELTRAVPDVISSKVAKPVRQFITAGSGDQTVPDKSIFRSQFVAGLNGEADANRDGYITGTELAQHLENTVTNYTRRAQTPRYGKIRDPYLDKGDYVFVVPGYQEKLAKEKVKMENSRKLESNLQVELAYWDSVKESNDPLLLNTYLKKYPNGQFAELANVSIQRLEMAQKQSQEQRLNQQEEAARREREIEKQRKLLAEIQKQKQMLAMARSANSVRTSTILPMGHHNRISVIAYAPVDLDYTEGFSSTKQYSAMMLNTLHGSIKIHSSGSAEISKMESYRTAEKLMYDKKDRLAKSICNQTKSDYLFAMSLEEKTMGIPNHQRSVRLVAFDCDKATRIRHNFLPRIYGKGMYNPNRREYPRERSIKNELNRFISEFVQTVAG